MIDFCCPDCNRKLFEAASASIPVLISIRCKSCRVPVTPVPRGRRAAERPMHRTYRCTTCRREQHVERPVNERTYCVVCGTTTLIIVAETPAPLSHQRPTEVPAHAVAHR